MSMLRSKSTGNFLANIQTAGLCLQAYLHRTASDIEALLSMKPSIRLVKGAYAEVPRVAIQDKKAIDANYFALAQGSVARADKRNGIAARICHA